MPNHHEPSKRIQFVVKASTLCNLRCRYCYEYEGLADKRRISLDSLENMFWNIAGWYRTVDPRTQLEFVWHGGEPLLNPPDYFWRAFDRQKAIFGTALPLRNVVQTNLTVLDDDRIQLLRDGFDGVGVSIDLFGELRANGAGKDSLPRTLRNIDRLRSEKIDFGAITVVSKANVKSIRKIVRFFHELRVSSLRLLPLFDGAYEDQHQDYEITHDEILEALKAAFEELHSLDSPLRVEPIQRYINQICHYHTPGSAPNIYDKREWESVLIVDTDGELYSYGDITSEYSHGNIFETPIESCIGSPGHLRACETAEARMRAACHDCRFFGSCDGGPMADDAGRQRTSVREAGQSDCIVAKGMLDYLEGRMLDLGVIDPITKTVRMPRPSGAIRLVERLPLQPGVRVHFEDADGIHERIRLSGGTTTEITPPSDGLSYLQVAVVPKMPWRSPNRDERALLVSDELPPTWSIGSDIGVVRIPDGIMEPFEAIFEDFGTREVLDRDLYRDHTSHPGWSSAYQGLVDHILERYKLRDHGPTIVRLASAHPGMATVTKDEVRGKSEHYYVGLHLDTWEKIAMRERSDARNRICINMGREARQFLFINLTVQQIYDMLSRGEPGRVAEDYYGTDLGHEFMRAFPGYPVVKLMVRPREAYIAPTENMVHDATSVGKRYPDIALHVLGYFGMAPGETRRVGELQTRGRLQF